MRNLSFTSEGSPCKFRSNSVKASLRSGITWLLLLITEIILSFPLEKAFLCHREQLQAGDKLLSKDFVTELDEGVWWDAIVCIVSLKYEV